MRKTGIIVLIIMECMITAYAGLHGNSTKTAPLISDFPEISEDITINMKETTTTGKETSQIKDEWFYIDVNGIKHYVITASDNPDFLPLLHKTNSIIPVNIVLGDMSVDDENNHVGTKQIDAAAIIPTRYADVPICRTSGIHRKEMKRNFPKYLYSQRNKSETIFFVIKQIMSGDITSRNVITQDNEMLLRLIAYNAYRIRKLEFVILICFLQRRLKY